MAIAVVVYVVGLFTDLNDRISNLEQKIRTSELRDLRAKCEKLGGDFYEAGKARGVGWFSYVLEYDTCVKNSTSYIWSEWRGGFYNVKETQEVTPLK